MHAPERGLFDLAYIQIAVQWIERDALDVIEAEGVHRVRAVGGNANDVGYGIAIDGSGNVTIAGYTLSNPFDGITNAGNNDIVVAKYV